MVLGRGVGWGMMGWGSRGWRSRRCTRVSRVGGAEVLVDLEGWGSRGAWCEVGLLEVVAGFL